MDKSSDFLKFLSENDPFGLLKTNKIAKPKAKKSVLLNNFEEIVNFFEENNCEPSYSSNDIKEFQLFSRLKAIRNNSSMVKELKPYDLYGLLEGETVSSITLDDLLNEDPLNLLGDELDNSIFKMKNVKKTERIAPEYIARRQFCQNFEIYKPMFDSIHDDIEKGRRKLAMYRSEDLKAGNFYVLGGIILYLKSIDGGVSTYNYESGARERFDGRTECVFDNGTQSNMLFRSLDKAMQKDGYSISDYQEKNDKEEKIAPEDQSFGYVYVLRSHHAKLKNVPDVYKIGSTTNTVTERIRNAQNEPTYLYAGVDVVETYKCYNMSPRYLEDKIHAFFDKVRLNINIPDERGVVISPREWFCVKLDVIGEAIGLIVKGKIDNYIYDPMSRCIVQDRL